MAGSQSGAGEDQPTQIFPGQDAVIVTRLVEPPAPESQPATELVPQHPPTEVAGSATEQAQAAPTHPPTEVAPDPGPEAQAATAPEPTVTAPPGQAAGPPQQAAPPAPFPPPAPRPLAANPMPPSPAAGIVRYGPGVPVELPVSQGGRTAEHVWSGGPPPAPPRRSARLRRLGGTALTVLLLAASGVVLFLRFYHPPFQVTGAAITQHTTAGCRVDVTGRITTNGAAGTVAYRWQFKPAGQPGTTLRQSVISGQHAVDVTVAVEGSGSGTASRTAVLEVLSPGQRMASTHLTLSC
jgi:hypothetical protein